MGDDTTILTRADLVRWLGEGRKLEMLFFWGHRVPADGGVTKSCLSQWYPAIFVVDGVEYRTAEQFMMAEKARLFGDEAMRRRILAASDAREAKKLGRKVAGFMRDPWERERSGIVVRGNLAKFSQSPALRDYLLGTGSRILVEASPYDAIWGIGLREDDPGAMDPRRWPGENLLGFALMEVRSHLERGGG